MRTDVVIRVGIGKLLTGLAALILLALTGMPGYAAPELSMTGTPLAAMVLPDVRVGTVEKLVRADNEPVAATHIVVQMAGGQALMRDRQGVFQPWDRNTKTLADSGFVPVDGQILFKVFNQDLSAQNFPIRVTVYYRANGELKFGFFDVMRAN